MISPRTTRREWTTAPNTARDPRRHGLLPALTIRSDRHHQSAVAAARRYGEQGLLTTWPVLTETVHLIQRHGGSEPARGVLASVEAGAAKVFELTADHLPRIVELMEKYRELPMDLADASLVICVEATGDGRILSTDRRDFGAYRWKQRKPFRNVLKV